MPNEVGTIERSHFAYLHLSSTRTVSATQSTVAGGAHDLCEPAHTPFSPERPSTSLTPVGSSPGSFPRPSSRRVALDGFR